MSKIIKMKYIKHFNNLSDFNDKLITVDKPQLAFISDTKFILSYNKNAISSIEMIDLDLPSGLKWASCNVGATCGDTAETWYGNFYAWGEISTKQSYSWGNYKFGDVYKYTASVLTKYNDTDLKTTLDPMDDAGIVNQSLRMPTREELVELTKNTTSEWVDNYKNIEGLNGRLYASKTNGNFIFIPAAGFFDGTSSTVQNRGNEGEVWSKTIATSTKGMAYHLCIIRPKTNGVYEYSRDMGCPIRPVQ